MWLVAVLTAAQIVTQFPALVLPQSLVPARANALDGDAEVIATLVADPRPTAVAVNSTTNRIYVALQGTGTGAPSTVKVFSGADHALIATVPVGVNPSDILVNESTNKVYVVNNGNNVSVIDGLTNEVTATLAVGNPLKAALDAGRSRL